jgi:hypothetical protein
VRQTVAQDDERAGRAIQAALGVTVALPFVGLVVTEGEELAAAFIFNNFDRRNIDVTISVEKPVSPVCIREIARYVFGKLGVKRVTCVTHVDNAKAIKRLGKLGFEFEGWQRQRFPQGDGVMFSLLASEQRFTRIGGCSESATGSRSVCDSRSADPK